MHMLRLTHVCDHTNAQTRLKAAHECTLGRRRRSACESDGKQTRASTCVNIGSGVYFAVVKLFVGATTYLELSACTKRNVFA
eukprot:1942963-Pleurochrysis_carterae.AAC.1